MATDGTDMDFAARYAEALAPSTGAGSWQDREQEISREIAAGPDQTVAGFAWHFNDRYVRNIASLVASGNFAQAKRYYDDVTSAIEANRDHLLSISQVTDTGRIADALASRATSVLMGDYNQQQVRMSDGSVVTIGQVLADGSPYLADKSAELQSMQFSDEATQLYLANDPNAKALIDPFLRSSTPGAARAKGSGGGGVDQIPNRVQMRDLVNAYARDAERINGVFGGGTKQFLDDVRETHKTAGNAAATMRTLVDFAEAYSAETGVTGEQLATDIRNGYNDLVAAVFAKDDGSPANVTDMQRRTFDAAFLPAVRESMARTGGAFDMHDPRLRQSMLEVMDTVAYTSALGGDLFASARGAGREINKMFGAYVAEAMTGQTHMPDNIVTAVRDVKEQLDARLTGGRNYAEAAASLSGQQATYLANVDKVNKTKSLCPAADGIAAEAHKFLAHTMIEGVVKGQPAGAAFDRLASDPASARKLASYIAKSFHGRGKEEIALALSRGIINGLAAGDRANIEEMIGELCFGDPSRGLSPAALRTARAWYHGNVASNLQFAEQKTALHDQYVTEGFTDAQARRAVASVSEQASREMASGGDPLKVYRKALDVGSYLTETVVTEEYDAGGGTRAVRPVIDPMTRQPMRRVERRIGPRSEASVSWGGQQERPGLYSDDRVTWDAIQQRLRMELQQENLVTAYEAKRRAGKRVDDEKDTW